jgi:hypothetical protein
MFTPPAFWGRMTCLCILANVHASGVPGPNDLPLYPGECSRLRRSGAEWTAFVSWRMFTPPAFWGRRAAFVSWRMFTPPAFWGRMDAIRILPVVHAGGVREGSRWLSAKRDTNGKRRAIFASRRDARSLSGGHRLAWRVSRHPPQRRSTCKAEPQETFRI